MLVGGILLVLLLAIAPLTVTPQTRVRVAVGAIHAYQGSVSHYFNLTGIRCRFQPTCSQYAELAIAKYGVRRGVWMSARRLLRCNPMTPAGTVDLP
jgi:putative membrane protein insertion efficiency factor